MNVRSRIGQTRPHYANTISNQEIPMKKTNVYRGVRYNANDMKPESKQPKEGTYRGIKWKEKS